MVKIYYRNIKEGKLKTLEQPRVGVWVHAEAPDETEIQFLLKELKLDEGLLRDALDLDEVPRLEFEDGISYIYTRFPYDEHDQTETAPILIVVGGSFLLTLTPKRFSALAEFTDGVAEFFTTQKAKLLLQLFTSTVGAYNDYLKSISRRVRSARAQLRVENISNRDLVQFVTYEDVLNDFLSAIIPTNSILSRLLTGRFISLYEDDKELIEDLVLNNNQLIEQCKSDLKSIVNIREAYSTIMTNNLNRIIKLFTSLTVILTVPTMIASIYGMNVRLPLEQSPYAFWIVVAFVSLVSGFLLWVFIKKDWL